MHNYKIVNTCDGSKTLYSKKYNQHYHSVKDGAVNESLHKHVVPALTHHKNRESLRILDICFGLGYNTFSTIYYALQNNLDMKLKFYSPELDGRLIKSLYHFEYPDEFEPIKNIIEEVSQNLYYEDEKLKIEVFVGNAREYIKTLDDIDIVYQDAFSSDVNYELWTKEYFGDIYKIVNDDSIITTYSVATPVRLSMYENSFFIYENKNKFTRNGTLAFKQKQELPNFVNMELKKLRNPNAKPFVD